MAERSDLTPAEILARQRMLEEALAGQDADAELFGAVNQVQPENYGPKTVRGIPEADENLLKTLVSPLVPLETDVVREPESTYTQIPEAFQNPADMGNPELLRTSYTPGRYANPRLAAPPIVDSISGGLKFGNKLLFGDASEQAEAREKVSQGIGALPGLPKSMVESVIGGGRNVARGNITTQDAEGNITRPGQFAEGLAMFPAARAFSSVPEGTSFGVFGGRTGVEIGADVAEYERLRFEEQQPPNLAAAETGVFLGVDNQPRKFLGDFKIKDSFFALSKEIKDGLAARDGKPLKVPLSSVIYFPGLEKNYPTLAEAKVVLSPSFGSPENPNTIEYEAAAERLGKKSSLLKMEESNNFYDSETNTFYLRADAKMPRQDFTQAEKLKDYRFKQIKEALAKNIQEAIQFQEGFATPRPTGDYLLAGTNPEIVAMRNMGLTTDVEINAYFDELQKGREALQSEQVQSIAPLSSDASIRERSNRGSLEDSLGTLSNAIVTSYVYDANSSTNIANRYILGKNVIDELPEDALTISRPDFISYAESGELGARSAAKLTKAANQLRSKFGDKPSIVDRIRGAQSSEPGSFNVPADAEFTAQDVSKTITMLEGMAKDFKAPNKQFWQNQAGFAKQQATATKALKIAKEDKNRAPGAARMEQDVAAELAIRAGRDRDFVLRAERNALEMLDPTTATAQSQTMRQDVMNNTEGLLYGDRGFYDALDRGDTNLRQRTEEAARQGTPVYDPEKPFVAKIPVAITNVKRERGTPEQWMADIRKQNQKDLLGIKEESLKLLNLQEELKLEEQRLRQLDEDQVGFESSTRKKGTLTREEVLAVFERQDRPVDVEVLGSSKSYTTFLLPGKGRDTARTFVFRSLPKEGDTDFFIEQHFDRENPTEGKINTFAHNRVTSRVDVDDNKVFLAEEFQSEAFKPQKRDKDKLKSEGVALPHRSDWLNLSVERMLLAAAEEGFDTFAVPPGFVPHSMYNTGPTKKGYIDVYDKKIPALLKKMAKKYGMDYDDEISLPLENDRGKPLMIDQLERQIGEEAYINEELYNTPNREQAHISVRGLRITPEARKAILKAKVGRAQGGAVQRFNQGGMVSPMNKPRVTQGLTNLLNKYSTGPLAGAGNVSRGTPVQPFNQGGAAQTYEEALNDPNRMNLAKRLGPEAWASSGIGNTPSQPLVKSLEYRNYGSNKNVPQGDFNPIVPRTFTSEELSQRAADRGYGSVENLSKAEKAGLQLDQSPYFNSYETKSQMMNSPQGDQRYTNYDPGDYARGSGPKIMIDPVSSIPVTSIDYNLPGSGTSTGPISTGPVSTTPAYEDAPVSQTDNSEDNPVTSVPVVTPASTTPATTDPLTSDLAVSTTPGTTTPGTTTPVVASQPIVNPIDNTPLPPSVYNPPAPPEEAVYTPPAATVVDTPETLFTPPEVFDVPDAKDYQYLQDLRPDFDLSDVIKTQTGGYAPTQGMVINPTEYQYSPDQEMSDNVYVPQIYRPMPQFTLSDLDATEGTTSEDSTAETDTEDTAGTADTTDTTDTTQGTSFASLDSLSSNQQAYNPEQDYADRYGYTLAELREINAERLRMGLPRLQDLQTDIGDINFNGGM